MNLHFWFISFNVPQRGLHAFTYTRISPNNLIIIWFYLKVYLTDPYKLHRYNFVYFLLPGTIITNLQPKQVVSHFTWTPSWHLSHSNTSAVTYVMLRTTQALNYRGWRFPLHPRSQCKMNKITEWQSERVVQLLKKPFLKVHLALMKWEFILSTA